MGITIPVVNMVVGNLVYVFVVIYGLVASTGATEGHSNLAEYEYEYGDDIMTDMLDKMRIAFPQIDTDGDGKIRCDQLREFLLAADPIWEYDDYLEGVEMMATMADADNDDMLTLDELINFFTAIEEEEPTKAQQGAAMFKLYDTDLNGKMSLEELNAMYLAGGTGFGEGNTGIMEILQGLLQVMDTNKDGQVSLEEYVKQSMAPGGFTLHDY